MATVNYKLARVCENGGHVTLAVAVNGGQAREYSYTADEIRAPLSALTQDEIENAVLIVAKLHFAGDSRAAMRTALQAATGVTVTI